MKLRALILWTALVTSGGHAFSEPLLPEKLSYQDAATWKLIPYHDGVLVACDPLYAPDRYMFARFESKELSPVKITGIELLLDAEKSANGVLFLGLVETDLPELKVVISEESPDGKPRSLPVPDEFHAGFVGKAPQASTVPRLIGTNREAAAILGDVVWWLDKTTWKHRKLPKVPKFHDEFLTDEVHVARWFLDGTTLYGGWNHGEWGGALASIDLEAADSRWVNLGDKPLKDDSGIPEHIPVESILSPRKGELWVAAGLSHMGGTWRGLYHRELAGKWQTLIHGEFDTDHGELKPAIPSAIDGITFDREGSLYVLAGEAGIYRMEKSALKPVIAHVFYSHFSDREDYRVGCHPTDIAIARNGDIYVSTNAFGILAFRKTGEQWSGRQITLGKPEDKKDDAGSPPPPHESPEEK